MAVPPLDARDDRDDDAPAPGAPDVAAATDRGARGIGRAIQGVTWVLLYLAVVITPLVVALTADPPPGRSFWLEFSVGLGFVGLSLMGLQFAVVSRFSSVNAPFGLDAVLQYHKAISFTAFAFVLAHPAIIMIRDTAQLELLNPITAPWRARFGLISIVALIALIATSLWRTRFRLSYEAWRVLHGVMAVVIVVTALLHIQQVGYYVSGPWKQTLWIVSSVVLVALLVNIRLITPIRLLRRPWTVHSVRADGSDTYVLTLRPDGHDGLRFLPGQFAWLRIDRNPFSIHENPFSMSSSADRGDHVEFTIGVAGDFTAGLAAVEPGTRAYLDGPYGVFTYERNEGPDFVMIAGGVGIAPVLSMLRTLADRGDRRPCLLLYGAPSWDAVSHRDELERLGGLLDLRVVYVLEEAPDGWEGEQGMIDAGVLDRHLPRAHGRSRFFICGPPPMIAAVEALLEDGGVPREHVDHERFDIL
ncbi:MAG: oxidoreductase [Ilumatobacter sp.]|nr:MAG: oxidoreductase [Ilumatobacter sp.]